ncbi:MAG: hypothetical protein MR874_05250 [Coriobacteriaceae bacterium]|nr:hypothetical protein [Coriobacteriaceae bacterium]
MPAPKAAAPKKAARQAEAKAYVVLRAFTLSSTGEAFLVGEDFAGTDAQVATLMELGCIGEA